MSGLSYVQVAAARTKWMRKMAVGIVAAVFAARLKRGQRFKIPRHIQQTSVTHSPVGFYAFFSLFFLNFHPLTEALHSSWGQNEGRASISYSDWGRCDVMRVKPCEKKKKTKQKNKPAPVDRSMVNETSDFVRVGGVCVKSYFVSNQQKIQFEHLGFTSKLAPILYWVFSNCKVVCNRLVSHVLIT